MPWRQAVSTLSTRPSDTFNKSSRGTPCRPSVMDRATAGRGTTDPSSTGTAPAVISERVTTIAALPFHRSGQATTRSCCPGGHSSGPHRFRNSSQLIGGSTIWTSLSLLSMADTVSLLRWRRFVPSGPALRISTAKSTRSLSSLKDAGTFRMVRSNKS